MTGLIIDNFAGGGGASDAEGQAVTGHKKDSTFAHYRAKANRKTLATRAVSNLGSLAGFEPTENSEITNASNE